MLVGASSLACGELREELKQQGDKLRGDDVLARGVELYEAGRYTEAIEHYERARKLGVHYYSESQIEAMIGNAFIRLDRLDLGEQHQLRAIELDPKNHEAMVNLGVVYRNQGRLDEAETMYRRAQILAPNYAQLHSSLGVLYLAQGKLEEAEPPLLRALELDPQDPVTHANLAVVVAQSARFEEAERLRDRAIELGYHNPEGLREAIEQARSAHAASDGDGSDSSAR